jgi:hypothetical protein
MSYMNTHAAFAPAGGIQELSFDEIAHVGAGKGPTPPKPPSPGDKVRDAAKKIAKKIPGKKDDWILIGVAEGLGRFLDCVYSED